MPGCRAGCAPLLPGYGQLLQRRGKRAGALALPHSLYPTGGLALGGALRACPLACRAEPEVCGRGEEGLSVWGVGMGAGIQSPVCPACSFVTGAVAVALIHAMWGLTMCVRGKEL